MTKKTPTGGNYEVGHGRPPKDKQFAKGTSGNPRGRPKGSRSFADILKDVLSRKVTITENGKTRRGSALEGMLCGTVSDGLRRDKAARSLVFSLVARHGGSPETTIDLTELLSEDAEILAQARRDGLLPDLKADETPNPEHDVEGGNDEEADDGDPV